MRLTILILTSLLLTTWSKGQDANELMLFVDINAIGVSRPVMIGSEITKY